MRYREVIIAHDVSSDGKNGDFSRTDDVKITEKVDFSDLMLSSEILQGLKKSGFKQPSPIQLKALPIGKLGLDLIVQAKSGTGKTLVFVVTALESVVMENSAPQVIVLAPTREIANQIFTCFKRIGSKKIEDGLTIRLFIGGTDIRQDIKSLKDYRGCQILVGTPGRICQLISDGHAALNAVRLLILDEADKLMEDNFQQTVNWIFSQMPPSKQITVFSATYPQQLDQFLAQYMETPTMVKMDDGDVQLLGIKQYVCVVSLSGPGAASPRLRSYEDGFVEGGGMKDEDWTENILMSKIRKLETILRDVNYSQVLVFCNYQDKAKQVSEKLVERGWEALFISGKLEQQERLDIMKKLKGSKVRLLVSTDLTARGIDAQNVNLVINLEVPIDTETYFHRIGRAGRFGGYGAAITLITQTVDENRYLKIGTAGQFRVAILPQTDMETIPSDLCTNEKYWQSLSLYKFPMTKNSNSGSTFGAHNKENWKPKGGQKWIPPQENRTNFRKRRTDFSWKKVVRTRRIVYRAFAKFVRVY